MSKIDELLKNEKVEWKKLGDIGEFYGGITGKTKQDFNGGNAKFITYKNVYLNPSTDLDVKDKVKIKVNENQRKLMYGDILFTGSSETSDECGMSSVITTNLKEDIYLNSFCFFLRLNNLNLLLPDFSKHLFRSETLRAKIGKTASGVTRFNVSKDLMKKIEIPIPSLETQEKIVKILDKFTNCVTELQAELQDRTKQYEYYRDLLLSEDYLNKISEKIDGFENKKYELKTTTLGEIGLFTRGNGLQKKDFVSKGNPVIHYGQIYTKYGFETNKTISFTSDELFQKLKKAKHNDILIATTSENIEDVGKAVVWLGNEKVGFSGDMYSYSTTENSKYIAYYFQTTEFQKQKERKVTGTKLIRIHGDDMAKFLISLPPIPIQNKVVEILDKFQSLLFDTKGLLPQEIEQRQKQYEYYREKLLTFDKNMLERERESSHISRWYLSVLKEAATIVGVNLNKIEKRGIGEVTEIILGGTPNKNKSEYWDNGTIPWMSSGEVNKKTIYKTDNFITQLGYDNSSATMVPANSTVIALAGQGKTRGLVARIKINLSTNQSLATLVPKTGLNNDYLYYCLQGQYIKLREVSSGDGSRGGLNKNILNKYPVLVPSLPVQEYIVSILDKFDALINDISQGLPKEIELRQKQYEYYRERLLNFPRKN